MSETVSNETSLIGRHVEEAAPRLESVPSVLRESVGFLLSKAADQAESKFAAALRPHGISPRQYGVLASIAHQGPQSQHDLGERLGIDRTSMVGIIDALEDAGFVKRVRDPLDRRRYGITLSEEGEALLSERLMRINAETHAEYLSALNADERDQLFDFLRRLVQAGA
jgi:DNA-binding MarR family transcriptional regulator